jgi:hypothetical protein
MSSLSLFIFYLNVIFRSCKIQLCIAKSVCSANFGASTGCAFRVCARATNFSPPVEVSSAPRVVYAQTTLQTIFAAPHYRATVVDGLRRISYLPNIVTILDTQRCMPHRFGVSSIVHLSLLFTWYQMTRVSSIPVSSSIAAAAAYCRHVRPAPMTSSALTSAISQGRRPCLHGIVLHLFLLLHP